MIKKASRAKIREKKHTRLRSHLKGTAERPRLAVFRSNSHMYAQIIDDEAGKTLAAASTTEKAGRPSVVRKASRSCPALPAGAQPST